jgi:hypothetical protein
MTPSSALSRNFPTLRYVIAPLRWPFATRQRRRTTAAILLAMIAGPVLWWSIQLMGLPDAGEPFDVAAFRSARIPDDRNAYVLYEQAARSLARPVPKFRWSPMNPFQETPQPKGAAEARRWVESNREAMELYRRGTDRPDAMDPIAPTDPQWWKLSEALWWFHELAQLEAGRLVQEGDMAGAWTWYRAAYHLGLRGTADARMNALRWHEELRPLLKSWAADRRTTPALLRQALEQVVACGAFRPSETYTLQAEYLQLRWWLDGPQNPGSHGPVMRLQALFRSSEIRPLYEQMQAMADAWRFWRREPERSRRLLKLAFANWLAYEALPEGRRPSPDDNAFGRYEFYAFGPEAPAQARALSPAALVRWLNSATDLPELLNWWQLMRGFGFRGVWLWTLGPLQRAGHRELVVLLARELYRRDRGADPPSDQALVGPYLKELPDDGDVGGASNQPAAGAVQ